MPPPLVDGVPRVGERSPIVHALNETEVELPGRKFRQMHYVNAACFTPNGSEYRAMRSGSNFEHNFFTISAIVVIRNFR